MMEAEGFSSIVQILQIAYRAHVPKMHALIDVNFHKNRRLR